MPIQKEHSEIVVLGGGPGGYVAALVAAQRGAQVILVEKARVGGTCLNIGCIPTKALTTSMDMLLRSRRAGEFGLSIPRVYVDLPALMTYKRNTVDELVGGVESLLKARHVKVICGEARLIKPDTLFVDDSKGGQWELSANHIILAPGSVATTPPMEGCNLPGVLTSTSALDIDVVPDRLVVVGGGVIGPHVTDIIAEGVLAVQMGITADDLAWTMHAHPTLPEATMEAALGFRNATIHSVSR